MLSIAIFQDTDVMLSAMFVINVPVKTRSSAIAVIADRTACSILTLYSLQSQQLDL